WTVVPVPTGIGWRSMATSADGYKLAALGNDNRIYLSSNAGLTWSSNGTPSYQWKAIAMSASGSRLIAGAGGSASTQPGPAFISTNSGSTWSAATSAPRTWYSLAASGDGLKMAAADIGGQRVLTSTNGGLSWVTNSPPVSAPWNAIASSADGN